MNSTPTFSLPLSAAGAPSGELLPFDVAQTIFSAANIVDLIAMLERTPATPDEVVLSAARLEKSNMAELYYVQGMWLAEMMDAVEVIPLADASDLPEHVAKYPHSSLAALSKRLVEQESASGSYV